MIERIARREWLVVGSLVALSLVLRLWRLGFVPPGVRFDELVNIKMANHIYAGEWPIYFQEAWGHEPLYHYLHALGMSLLGKTVLGVRITSILFGVLGVPAAYLVFRRLFGRAVASIAALLLATSFWSLLYSRFGDRHISLPPCVCLTVYCFWRGLETPVHERKRVALWFALGGGCLGTMLYTYFASRVVPAILIAFTLYLLLLHRQMLHGRWSALILFFALPVLIVTPMVLYLQQHPELEQRLGQVGGEMLAALRVGNVRPLLTAVWNTLRMFSLRGDPEWLYNIAGRPVFDPVSSIAFYVGLAFSLWRWRDPRRVLLLFWLAVGISPSLLSWPPGSLGHTIVAQPAAMGFVALGLVDVLRWTERQAPRWLLWSGRGLVALTLTVFIALNSYDYFARWPRFREVRREYQAPITAVARYLRDHPADVPPCVSAPYVDYWNPWSKMNFDLYAGKNSAQVRWFDGRQSILFPAGGQALFFLPDHLNGDSELGTDLGELLMRGSQPVEISYRDRTDSGFDLYHWSDVTVLDERLKSVASAPVWASPETAYVANESEAQRRSLDLPLDFGHRLSLLGYRYELDHATGGHEWTVTSYWRVLDADSSPLALFVHILDDTNAVRTGWDGLYVSPEGWQVNDVLIHAHTLTIPVDLSAGEQRVEVGAYSPITLERLTVFTGDADLTAPYNRAMLRSLRIE